MIKKFTIGSRDYRVEILDGIKNNTCLGIVHNPIGLIQLAKLYKGKKIPKDSIEQTLYHEVTHAILDELGYHKLSKDEKFVQGFSLLLHQFEKTKQR